jgi:hypothetical protein
MSSAGDGAIFDRVVVVTAAGEQTLTAKEFVSLPLTKRVRLLLEARLQFFSGKQQVDAARALNSLRREGAAG